MQQPCETKISKNKKKKMKKKLKKQIEKQKLQQDEIDQCMLQEEEDSIEKSNNTSQERPENCNTNSTSNSLKVRTKVLLHCAIFSATCLATPIKK